MDSQCWQETEGEGVLDCLHLDKFCQEDPDHHHVEGCPMGLGPTPRSLPDSFNEYVVKVSLIVKAPGRQEAENFAAIRLGQWMAEPANITQGYGYPDGTLLLYTFQREEAKVGSV